MRLLHAASLVLAIAAAPAWPQAMHAPHPEELSAHEAAVDMDLEDRVRSFLEAFIDGENTPSEQLAFFADRVHYYDRGVLGRNAIARDIGYTMRRWPWRHNRLVEIEYLKPFPEEDKVFVSYVVAYEVSDARRTVRGTARYGATIGGLEDQPRIESIAEKISRQRREGGPE